MKVSFDQRLEAVKSQLRKSTVNMQKQMQSVLHATVEKIEDEAKLQVLSHQECTYAVLKYIPDDHAGAAAAA